MKTEQIIEHVSVSDPHAQSNKKSELMLMRRTTASV